MIAPTRLLTAATSLAILAVMSISAALAASSVVQDPEGDAGSAAPYLDLVHGQVIDQQGSETLRFMMVLAGAIPDQPSEPDLIWPFHVDTDPATAPGGLYNEYVVRVRWFTGAFVGQVIDRTPLLTGGAPIITAVPFSIDGRTVKVFVPLSTLGNPSTFGWNAATRPGATVPYVDFAPDGGSASDLATWTR
jgi:hypothetical protein